MIFYGSVATCIVQSRNSLKLSFLCIMDSQCRDFSIIYICDPKLIVGRSGSFVHSTPFWVFKVSLIESSAGAYIYISKQTSANGSNKPCDPRDGNPRISILNYFLTKVSLSALEFGQQFIMIYAEFTTKLQRRSFCLSGR